MKPAFVSVLCFPALTFVLAGSQRTRRIKLHLLKNVIVPGHKQAAKRWSVWSSLSSGFAFFFFTGMGIALNIYDFRMED